MSHKPIAFVYEASVNCPKCALKRFSCSSIDELGGKIDHEGGHVGFLYSWDINDDINRCDTCLELTF